MFQNRIIKTCLGFLSLSFSFASYADCPNISQLEIQADGSHLARTEQGIWKQFINGQSYYSINGTLPPLILSFVYGFDPSENRNEYQKVNCVYFVTSQENMDENKFIFLTSPIRQKYLIANNPEENITHWMERTNPIDNKKFTMCFSSLSSTNSCKFYAL